MNSNITQKFASETRVIRYFQERMSYGLFLSRQMFTPIATSSETLRTSPALVCRPRS